MQVRAAASKAGGSFFILWLETTVKALSSPGKVQSPGRACPRETGDFSISGHTQRTFLSTLLSSQPSGSATGAPQAAQPTPACVGAGCQRAPP